MMDRGMRQLVRTSSVALAAALVLAGCSSGGEDPTSGESTSTSPMETPSDAVVEDDEGNRAQMPRELGEPVGTRSIKARGFTLDLSLYPLTRGEGGVVLNAHFVVADGPEDTAVPSHVLTGGDSFDRVWGRADGFELVDQRAGKVYLPARDSEDKALCGPDIRNMELGDEAYLTCLFGAPPEDTDAVTVTMQTFGSIADVPIR